MSPPLRRREGTGVDASVIFQFFSANEGLRAAYFQWAEDGGFEFDWDLRKGEYVQIMYFR